jgi:hypothetical protein
LQDRQYWDPGFGAIIELSYRPPTVIDLIVTIVERMVVLSFKYLVVISGAIEMYRIIDAVMRELEGWLLVLAFRDYD